MRVYGLDFTSNPTRSKRLTLAECFLDKVVLRIDKLTALPSQQDGDFQAFENWLKGTGDWANESAWIAGIDFPFGMPIEAIEHFEWLPAGSGSQSWNEYLTNLYRETDAQSFRGVIEGWRHSTRKNKKGERIRVRKQRLTDRLGNSGSPMNYFPPPVCPMFFQGAQRLKACPTSASIVPVRIVPDSPKTIVEAYPRLVANVFIGRTASYKDKSKKKDANKERQKELRQHDEAEKKTRREQIVDGLTSEETQNRYGFRLDLSESAKRECTDDNDGDKLDSVLCAVQAAWAAKTANYGMPDFTLKALQDQVRLEGWIADPFVLQRLKDGDS